MQSISQEELAFRANINPAYLGQIERGIKCPTVDTLCRIAGALNIVPAELLQTTPVHIVNFDYSHRVSELLAQIPTEKRGKLLQIIEDIVDIYE